MSSNSVIQDQGSNASKQHNKIPKELQMLAVFVFHRAKECRLQKRRAIHAPDYANYTWEFLRYGVDHEEKIGLIEYLENDVVFRYEESDDGKYVVRYRGTRIQ